MRPVFASRVLATVEFEGPVECRTVEDDLELWLFSTLGTFEPVGVRWELDNRPSPHEASVRTGVSSGVSWFCDTVHVSTLVCEPK